jgi:hypothetical protein
VVHSIRESACEITQLEPWLEITAGPWEQGETTTVPQELLEAVLRICGFEDV